MVVYVAIAFMFVHGELQKAMPIGRGEPGGSEAKCQAWLDKKIADVIAEDGPPPEGVVVVGKCVAVEAPK